MSDVAEADECRIVVDYDACTTQTDKCDVDTDTDTDGFLQCFRYDVDYLFSDVGHCQKNENQAFEEDGGQCKLPTVAHNHTDAEREECIQTHARSQSEWQFGIKSHEHSGCCRNDNCG